MNIVLWGTGNTAKDFLQKKGYYKHDRIIACVDNNREVWGKKIKDDIKIISPNHLKELDYQKLIICSVHEKEIRKQVVEELGVDINKITSLTQIEEDIKEQVIKKYMMSQDPSVKDSEIQEVIHYYQENNLNIYGNYSAKRELYPVYRDENHHPYIIFIDKRMYYPDEFTFIKTDGKEYVDDVLYEQKKGSPHMYITKDNEVKDNGVIVDAGVCEGNFALQYVEKAKKIYLIEADVMWMKALEMTFKPYKDKVVFSNKFLTRYDSYTTTTLDSLIKEPIDFLKMDIEGAEIDALLGGYDLMMNSNASCAVCSYHKQNDEKAIRFILESYGYSTSVSEGYMFFTYDENILDTLDLRRGVVYGKKSVV